LREYAFYVILFFLPIAFGMAYLLRRDGWSWKYISVILIVALVIILTFPISMEKLGGLITFIAYLFLLCI